MPSPLEERGGAGPRTAVLLVGYGSRRPGVEADLARLAGAVAAMANLSWVEPCRLGELGARLERCAEQGAREICVQPFFLGMVGELASRLRQTVSRWQATSPQVWVRVGEALGNHPLLTRCIRDTALDALGGRAGSLVLVGHGSPDPEWSTAVHAQVNRLRSESHFDDVRPAFLDHEEPRLEAVLDELCGQVVVVPFFLSRGVHTSVELPTLVAGAHRPTDRIRLAHAWGDDPRIALAVADRVTRLPPGIHDRAGAYLAGN
jgi:sirohydrochlorin ferrochelatase